MTVRSYPFIAVDFSGNQHDLEGRGHSPGQAAEEILRNHADFRAVLNGQQGGKGNVYRKLIRTQHGVKPQDMETTILGQALLQAQSTQSLEAGRLILSAAQKKGLRLEIMEKEDGSEKIVVRPKGMITPEESREIDENQASIVVLLRQREEQAASDASSATPPKESQRDIVRKMIPKLPNSFIRYDLEQALRRQNYHDLADKSSKIDNLLAWCATQGLIERTGKGRYKRIPIPVEIDAPESATSIQSSEEPPQEAPPAARNPLDALFGSLSVIEKQTLSGGEAPSRVDEPAPDPPPREPLTLTREPMSTQQNPQPAPALTPSLAQAVIDLTSELVTVPIDEPTLDAVERLFMEFYERMDGLIKQLRANARARDRLRAQLASGRQI